MEDVKDGCNVDNIGIALKALRKFFRDRPALSKSAIAREVGISRQYLDYILKGDRPLNEATRLRMQPVLIRYGYRFPGVKDDVANLCPVCGQVYPRHLYIPEERQHPRQP